MNSNVVERRVKPTKVDPKEQARALQARVERAVGMLAHSARFVDDDECVLSFVSPLDCNFVLFSISIIHVAPSGKWIVGRVSHDLSGGKQWDTLMELNHS